MDIGEEGVYVSIVYDPIDPYETHEDDVLYAVAGTDKWAVINDAEDSAFEIDIALNLNTAVFTDWVPFNEFIDEYSSGNAALDAERIEKLVAGEIVLL